MNSNFKFQNFSLLCRDNPVTHTTAFQQKYTFFKVSVEPLNIFMVCKYLGRCLFLL